MSIVFNNAGVGNPIPARLVALPYSLLLQLPAGSADQKPPPCVLLEVEVLTPSGGTRRGIVLGISVQIVKGMLS
jgi:hypothetical protein